MSDLPDNRIITAAMIAIGNELLSGRTKDLNIAYLAEKLTLNGIDLKEVRIVSDDKTAIIEAVQALSAHYHYVFTSGGIGPTHDDITADAVSKAFNRPCTINKWADEMLRIFYQSRQTEYTPSRRRMARMPEGAALIANPLSVAPGFIIENVYVLAGVPAVFQVMVDGLLPKLEKGSPILSKTIPCPLGEGMIGEYLSQIQQENPETEIGSYPHYEYSGFSLELVVRSRNQTALDQASRAISAMIEQLVAKAPS